MRIAPAVHLSGPERQQLKQWARGRRTPARLVLRAKIVLLAAAGHDNHQIAAAVATSRQTVGLWRQRFVTQRVLGLTRDAPRGGRPPQGTSDPDRAHPEDNDAHETTCRHPLVHPHLGATPADESHVRAAGLDCAWAPSPSGPHLQAQSGSALPGEIGGCGGALSPSASACGGAGR